MKKTHLLIVASIGLTLITGCDSFGRLKDSADKLAFERTVVAPEVHYSMSSVAPGGLSEATAAALEQGLLVTGTNYSTVSITNAVNGLVSQEQIAQLEVIKPAVYKYEAKPTIPNAIGTGLAILGVPAGKLIGGLLAVAMTGFAGWRTSKSRGEKVIRALIEANEDARAVMGKHIEEFNKTPETTLDASELDRKIIKHMKQVHRGQGVATQIATFVEKFTGARNNLW